MGAHRPRYESVVDAVPVKDESLMTAHAWKTACLLVIIATCEAIGALQEPTRSYVLDNGPTVVNPAVPEYPPIAVSACVQGTVPVVVELDADGNVTGTDVIHGHVLLRRAAEEAARQWTFEPARNAARRRQVIRFSFRLVSWRATKEDLRVQFNPPSDLELKSQTAVISTSGGGLNERLTVEHEKKCLGTRSR
ncbi:MAG: energy transducer TonB [Vicinamibacterales bacterium]